MKTEELLLLATELYENYGQKKVMGNSAPTSTMPHFFLLRYFWNELDLLAILNTKRCSYQCHFCQLPQKSSRTLIPSSDILSQFAYILSETKHILSLIERVTLSNEGSVLDSKTFPTDALLAIISSINKLRLVRTIVCETRLEFVNPEIAKAMQKRLGKAKLEILTGFETRDAYIRDNVLGKNETIQQFLQGLDAVAESGASLTSYVLYKPKSDMNDQEAYYEANSTIDFLFSECKKRKIPLSVRINPMYVAQGSIWEKEMKSKNEKYLPPKITDIMKLAEEKTKSLGIKTYIGLSTEGISDPTSTFMAREDYSPRLIKPIKLFNDGKITSFEWS